MLISFLFFFQVFIPAAVLAAVVHLPFDIGLLSVFLTA